MPIVIDADAFPSGTILNNAFANVTLTAIGDAGVLVNSNVLSAFDLDAPTGTQVFADTSSSPNYWGDGIFSFLRADFALGATSVSLIFAANDESDTDPILKAFSSSNVLLDSATVVGLVPLGAPVTLSVSSPNIAYITATWDEVQRVDNGILDHLVYEPAQVPEPSVLLSLGAGLLALAVRVGRRPGR